MNKLKDAHYFPLPSQGNIYTFTNLKLANETNKLLIASLNREVFCFEYQETSTGVLNPTVKEVSFTYIPSGAEIISVDAFNKSETSNDFVIGITIIKNSIDLNTLETYLNIYSEWEESSDFNIESIAQNCLNVELNFIPYHLNHTYIVVWDESDLAILEVIFLLSGSDNQIHVYRESKTNHSYKESDCKEYFPEFMKLPSIATWIDIVYYNNFTERLSAVGCECGYVRLCRVDVKSSKIIFNFSTRFVSSITNVKFQIERKYNTKPFLIAEGKELNNEVINLVVTNSILPAVFFKDVKTYGLRKYGSLKRCEMTSVSSCLEFADIDFDGHEEIIIGNSTKELLMYKFAPESGWCLSEIKKIVSPVLGVKYIDITGDGVKELIVFSMKGVYVFQHDSEDVQQKLEEKIKLQLGQIDVPVK